MEEEAYQLGLSQLLLVVYCCTMTEFGGSLCLNRHWAYLLLRRMKFVLRKATTSKSKYSDVNLSALKKSFLKRQYKWRKYQLN